jgi:hypothetical protein
MSNIKSFSSFVNESILVMEGRYDNIVGQIVSDTINLIKRSNNGEETYDGIKVRYTAKDDVPSFYELIENGTYLNVGEYTTERSGIDVTVKLVIVRDELPVYPDAYIISGDADDESAVIYLEISINPEFEPQCYSDITPDLRDIVRHEVEHLTQRGWNEKPNKFIRHNLGAREKIQLDPNLRYRYYQLKDEVDANLHGLYAKAKTTKRPFSDVAMEFLDRQARKGIIPENKKREIYNVWKKRAAIIKGLPPL